MTEKMVLVTVNDGRGGHDGAANGGDYGSFEKLLVRPKVGTKIQETVFLVSDRDDGFYQSGHRLNHHQADRVTVFAIDPTKVEWACVVRGYDAQPMLGSSDRRSWEAIPGLKGGPKVELQAFLEAYPEWVNENTGPATEWLMARARELKQNDVVSAIFFARRKTSKGRINSAWQEVANLLGVQVDWKDSWTAVRSAPIRIAQAVQRKYADSWELKGGRAFRPKSERPVHPGECGAYVTLPSPDMSSVHKLTTTKAA